MGPLSTQFQHHLRQIQRKIDAFRDNPKGVVGVVFALAIIPTMALTGLAVDFSNSTAVRNRLQAAADSAVLEAIKVAQVQDEANNVSADYKRSDVGFVPISRGNTLFQTIASADTSASSQAITIEIERKGNDYFSRGTYSAKYKMMMPTFLAPSVVSVEGKAEAALSVSGSGFMDVYTLLDASPSMGTGASPADIATLRATTGCAFTCHAADSPAGVTLRMDVLRGAVNNMITTAKNSVAEGDTPRIKIGLYPFEGTTKALIDLTDNYTQLASKVPSLKINQDGTWSTNIGGAFNWLTPKVAASGTGLTADSPKKFVFIVTDGMENRAHSWRVQNYLGPTSYGGHTGSINPAHCADLKAKGVTVAVLYTTYTDLNNSGTEWAYQSALPGVEPNLRKCASPDFFFQASNASELTTQFGKMFKKAVLATSPRLKI